ncbi:MAG: hypothetical protein LQ342_008385 [Letrouitia transgressa]|nr:MAG: hypothetical protein LQ342_008385 [Letrouitia transgressa]
MTSFERLRASVLQGTQETTLALASINFDFSLIKYEAPVEFQGLGASLSKKRKHEAEDGSLHIVARKLGALFDGEVPEVPHLVQAYGKRATEIAEMPAVNPKGTKSDGAFADSVGADGTTIWAAATSGGSVVTVHLLACMLARIWSRSEAVSIWDELVFRRKNHLTKDIHTSASFHTTAIAASRIHLTRDQLADWDAGARAWLRTADEAKRVQQTQLRLVLDNISLSVSRESDVYKSVIRTWTRALSAFEKVILGQPQRIQDGGVLLALSSWHIYPDLFVFGEASREIAQNDSLVSRGGIISLGLQSGEEQSDGIWWSLPLTYMRFYGEPVVSTGHSGMGQAQVTFDQFLCVALGSIFHSWDVSTCDIEKCLNFIMLLSKSVKESQNRKDTNARTRNELDWLHCLSRTAKKITTSSSKERQEYERLISFGERRCPDFVTSVASHPCPAFGLSNIQLILRTLGSSEDRIALLRQWAAFSIPDIKDAVIRFREGPYGKSFYTYLFQPVKHGVKRSHRGKMIGNDPFRWHTPAYDSDPYVFDQDVLDGPADFRGDHKSRQVFTFRQSCPCEHSQCSQALLGYEFLFGNPGTAAIFIPVLSKDGKREKEVRNCVEVDILQQMIEQGYLRISELTETFLSANWLHQSYLEYFTSLQMLGCANKTYDLLPSARVNLQVTSQPLLKWDWVQALTRKTTRKDASQNTGSINESTQLAETFSCIACLETGYMNIPPSKLNSSFAISHENSIFVASKVISDPTGYLSNFPVKRIVGNIGKPGLAVLISPQNPKMLAIDYGKWNIITHCPFDGKLEDNFASTSLHLSLTGYEHPLDLGDYGRRDRDGNVLEAVISVYERGDWIADLDVIKAHGSWHRESPSCSHAEDIRMDISDFPSLTCVDSWIELLDRPSEECIVRAKGNSLARLAAATIAAQKGYKFCVVPSECCWKCEFAQDRQDEEIMSAKTLSTGPIDRRKERSLSVASLNSNDAPHEDNIRDTISSIDSNDSMSAGFDSDFETSVPQREIRKAPKNPGTMFIY